MKQYAFTVSGAPVGKQRPRTVNKNGKTWTFTPKSTVAYERRIKQAAIDAGVEMMDWCCVDMTMHVCCNKNNSIPKKYPDPDNVYKSCLDAMQGVAYENDRVAISGNIECLFIPHNTYPYVRISLQELDVKDYMRSFEDE